MNHDRQHERVHDETAPAADQSQNELLRPAIPGYIEPAPRLTAEPADDKRHPQIWVGSWLDYNNALLHGRWIPAGQSVEELHAAVAAMLADSPTAAMYSIPAEDWGIFDTDDFAGLKIGERESLERVASLARGVAMHGGAFAAWADIASWDDDEDVLELFSEAYYGRFDSLAAYAESCDDLSIEAALDSISEPLRPYVRIDYASLGHDMWLNGDITVAYDEEQPGVFIFDPRV